jgi:N-acetylmuramoyl-L-alanine amidase
VLKSPDIPSVLLELGFLSNKKDRANLKNPEWRAAMAEAIRDAILAWQRADEATADLVRQ